jgi:peptide/nickel transport system permease protein
MRTYILKRLFLFAPTLLLSSLIIFTLTRIVPGDAIDGLFADDTSTVLFTPDQRQQIRADLGLDRPLPVQYAQWVAGAFTGNLGTSFFEKRANWEIIRERLPRSVQLGLMAMVVGISWGITSGVISAVKRGTWVDNLLRVITVGGLAFPSFFIAVMLFYALIVFFQWIPPVQWASLLEDPRSNLTQLAAPALILGYAQGASISRLTRSQFLEVFREDYIRTARAKGLRENVVIIRHALRNSILPVITVMGLLVGQLIAGVVVVETVFGIPGMGRQLVQAINFRDYPLIQAIVWNLTLAFLIANLLVDITYAWIDPRIKFGGSRA